MRSNAALLEVRALTKRFGGLTALSELDFHVNEGEILGLIGPNGAGKTTTFSAIAGALAPSSGSIRFAGEPIVGLAPHAIAARGVLRTFQHNRPFAGMPVLDNVLVGAHMRFNRSLWRVISGPGAHEVQKASQRTEALVDLIGHGEAREKAVST